MLALPSRNPWLVLHLYLILDIYSRKIVGWEVEVEESGEHGAALLLRTALREGIARQREPLALHADNGSPMKSASLSATLQWLGVQPSHSRPRVSNDNAYAESMFRTCKYRPANFTDVGPPFHRKAGRRFTDVGPVTVGAARRG